MRIGIHPLSVMAVLLALSMTGCCNDKGSVLGIPTVGPVGGPQTPPPGGTTNLFRVLAGTTVTSVGPTTVTGDVGVWPGTAVSGFPPGTMTGNGGLPHAGDSVAQTAQGDLTVAYNSAAGRPPGASVSGNIGGLTLAPGIYTSTSSLAISSGDLTLDGRGSSSAVFIFQIPSSLTVTTGRKVLLVGGAQAANVYWQIGSSATIGTNAIFYGTMLADVSISLLTGSVLHGRALARTGAVSMDGSIVGP